jgi:hypothetical protein
MRSGRLHRRALLLRRVGLSLMMAHHLALCGAHGPLSRRGACLRLRGVAEQAASILLL